MEACHAHAPVADQPALESKPPTIQWYEKSTYMTFPTTTRAHYDIKSSIVQYHIPHTDLRGWTAEAGFQDKRLMMAASEGRETSNVGT